MCCNVYIYIYSRLVMYCNKYIYVCEHVIKYRTVSMQQTPTKKTVTNIIKKTRKTDPSFQEFMNDTLCFTFIEQLYKARFSKKKIK